LSHRIVLDLHDTVKLLAGERDERFRYERAIRLFQFRTWLLFPKPKMTAPKVAGRIAAASFMRDVEADVLGRKAEGDISADSFIRVLRNPDFRNIHDRVIGKYGGLTELLYMPTPKQFDRKVQERLKKSFLYP
jgi:hypothetical protein